MTRQATEDFPLDKIADAVRNRLYEQLRKLGELRDLGIVTGEEFEQKKRELLARI